jgi:site-specific DNA-cytosine methylase
MSITTIACQAQGMHAGEVIAKLAEDAYFMRVDNRVTQVPPVRNRQQDNEATSRSADIGRNRTRGELPANPTVPGHRPVDPLMVATAPAAPAATVRSSLTMILAAEAVTAGAPAMGLAGEPGWRRPRRPRPREQPRLRSFMWRFQLPPEDRRTLAQEVLHGKRQRWLPRLLCTASQPTSPGEIQASRDHQVRHEAGSSAVAVGVLDRQPTTGSTRSR